MPLCVTLWNGVFKQREKGRGRRKTETLGPINNSCSADDLWIAVVNRLLWLLNQLYYMPARNRKWPMTPLLLQFNLLWLAKGGEKTRRLMNGKLDFVRIFVWDVFHLRWRGKFFLKWCIIRHQNPPQYNSPLMTDRVEIRPWRDRHQFNGNCIVFFMRKPQSEKQYREEMSLRNAVRIMEMWWWIWKGIVQHFLPSCVAFQRWFISWLACFWSCVVAGFNILAAKMALKAVLYLYPHPTPHIHPPSQHS